MDLFKLVHLGHPTTTWTHGNNPPPPTHTHRPVKHVHLGTSKPHKDTPVTFPLSLSHLTKMSPKAGLLLWKNSRLNSSLIQPSGTDTLVQSYSFQYRLVHTAVATSFFINIFLYHCRYNVNTFTCCHETHFSIAIDITIEHRTHFMMTSK